VNVSRQWIRLVAARAPRDLRTLRARSALERVHESLGIREVACPACHGTGWLDHDGLEFCPLCCGFREVPDRLADWFVIRAARRTSAARRRGAELPPRRRA